MEKLDKVFAFSSINTRFDTLDDGYVSEYAQSVVQVQSETKKTGFV